MPFQRMIGDESKFHIYSPSDGCKDLGFSFSATGITGEMCRVEDSTGGPGSVCGSISSVILDIYGDWIMKNSEIYSNGIGVLLGGNVRNLLGIVLCLAIAAIGCLSAASQESVDVILERIEQASELISSNAVVLLDYGESIVNLDGTISATIHEQILLLNWEAVETYGQVNFSYSENREDFALLYGRTILPDGEIVELDDSGVIRSSYSEGGGAEAFSEVKTLTLQLPSLRPGVVIDYSYRVTQEVPDLEEEFFDQWYFEWWEPVLQSAYILDVPTQFEFEWYVANRSLVPAIQTSSERTRYTFSAAAIPAFDSEVGMPSRIALASHVIASSIDSWETISSWWWGLARSKWEGTDEIVAMADELTSDTDSDDERIARLYDYVARQVRYVSLGFGTSGYEPRFAHETLATQYGDCKDQTILLIALLSCVGIEAYPALTNLEVGYNVDWSEPPSPFVFDHVIVAIPVAGVGWRYLDPTCSLCTATSNDGLLAGRNALLAIKAPAATEVKVLIPPLEPQETMVQCTLFGEVTSENVLELRADVETSGDHDIGQRDLFLYYRPSERDALFTAIVDFSLPQASLVDFSYSDLDDLYTPLSYQVQYEKERAVRWISGGTGLLSLPYGASIPLPEDYAEFVLHEQREYPLIVGSERIGLDASIELGDLLVRELPEDVVVENALGSFRASYTLDGSTLSYERILQIEVTQVSPDEFDLYRDIIMSMLEDAEAIAVLERD
jgi:transglutaminase-like putative cysteine protease